MWQVFVSEKYQAMTISNKQAFQKEKYQKHDWTLPIFLNAISLALNSTKRKRHSILYFSNRFCQPFFPSSSLYSPPPMDLMNRQHFELWPFMNISALFWSYPTNRQLWKPRRMSVVSTWEQQQMLFPQTFTILNINRFIIAGSNSLKALPKWLCCLSWCISNRSS